MGRIPHCEFKEDGCDDPNCKIGLCILRVKEEREECRRRAAEDAEIDEGAHVWAENHLKKSGNRPSYTQVHELAQNPKVRELVRKRLAEEKWLLA
jgi:hypothetical protein